MFRIIDHLYHILGSSQLLVARVFISVIHESVEWPQGGRQMRLPRMWFLFVSYLLIASMSSAADLTVAQKNENTNDVPANKWKETWKMIKIGTKWYLSYGFGRAPVRCARLCLLRGFQTAIRNQCQCHPGADGPRGVGGPCNGRGKGA